MCWPICISKLANLLRKKHNGGTAKLRAQLRNRHRQCVQGFATEKRLLPVRNRQKRGRNEHRLAVPPNVEHIERQHVRCGNETHRRDAVKYDNEKQQRDLQAIKLRQHRFVLFCSIGVFLLAIGSLGYIMHLSTRNNRSSRKTKKSSNKTCSSPRATRCCANTPTSPRTT